jgi:hypothetical protein
VDRRSQDYLKDIKEVFFKEERVPIVNKVYRLLSLNEDRSILLTNIASLKVKRQQYSLPFEYLPKHIQYYLQSNENNQYRANFFSILKIKGQTALASREILVDQYEYFVFRFLSFISEYREGSQASQSPRDRASKDIYKDVFSEYLAYFSEDPRISKGSGQVLQSDLKLFFLYMADEYLLHPVINYNLNLNKKVKNEILASMASTKLFVPSLVEPSSWKSSCS